jgi:hypothetical protein
MLFFSEKRLSAGKELEEDKTAAGDFLTKPVGAAKSFGAGIIDPLHS